MALAAFAVLLAPGYIDGGGWQVTLPEIISEFRTITLVEVEKVSLARGGFKFKVGKPLKGKPDFSAVGLQITWGEGGAPFKEMAAGRVAVHFTQSCAPELRTGSPEFENLISKRANLTFLDGLWLLTMPDVDGWQQGTPRRDFECAFSGTTAALADAVTKLLRGHDVSVQGRRQKHTEELQWIRYSLKMPNDKVLVRDPSAPAAATRPVLAWTAELKDVGSATRMRAALALAELGPAAREAEAALAEAVRDPDPEVRCAAVAALGALLPEGKAAIDGLGKALSDDDWFTRLAAAKALRRCGERARPALPAVLGALSPRDGLKDFRPIRCGEAMVALSRIDPRAKELETACALVVSKLLRDERQGSFGARATGARLLGECGPAAASTAGALTQLLRDGDGDARVAAAEALMKISPDSHREAAIAALIDALRSPELLIRGRAAEALGGLGARAKDALTALRAATQDPEPEVRAAALEAEVLMK
jgi:HEAT repeat protein